MERKKTHVKAILAYLICPVQGSIYTEYMSHTLAYNGAQTTMVASVDRVSHANGWSFHSELPGLTRDVNVDSEHKADTRGERGS